MNWNLIYGGMSLCSVIVATGMMLASPETLAASTPASTDITTTRVSSAPDTPDAERTLEVSSTRLASAFLGGSAASHRDYFTQVAQLTETYRAQQQSPHRQASTSHASTTSPPKRSTRISHRASRLREAITRFRGRSLRRQPDFINQLQQDRRAIDRARNRASRRR